MLTWHEKFPFVLVVMMGDNIYGSDRPQDFVKKFEAPYKPLLDAGVKFYASLGNHDSREQRYYKLFNMDGKRTTRSRRRRKRPLLRAREHLHGSDQLGWLEKRARLSTSTVSTARTLSSACSIQGSPLYVTTTTETSPFSFRPGTGARGSTRAAPPRQRSRLPRRATAQS